MCFNRNNAEATAMLNEIILSRIMTSIASQNINPNFASAIHPEMLLLTTCLEMEDSCWEQRLRAGTVYSGSYTVQLVIFVGLIFRGLGSSDDFVGLYFCGLPTLIT